ncbi:MAG: Na+-dependent transporter [Candidatus Methanogranum gryphiswaldense]|nr:MAG: Na+-dependent transporter [Candidatus Methanogranum sp. U3.2.1]
MKIKTLLCSSAFMMSLALIISLITNFAGWFPADVLNSTMRSNITILLLAIMMTVSLSRIPTQNLKPDKAIIRALFLGLLVASAIPIVGYMLLKNGQYSNYAVGWVFIAATPFAASVAPLSFILRGDMEHACRSTIYVYITALVWIPLVIYLLIGEYVNMENVILTVIEIIGVPLVLSRLLTKVQIPKDVMAITLNCIIGFLVWLSVSSTNFKGLGISIFIIFAIIAICRTFVLGNAVEYVEKKNGLHWNQRVTDILMTSYKNKGIAIALCVSVLSGPMIGYAMVAITVSIVVEICWVIFMDSVLFSRKRMRRELKQEGSEVVDL